jgi:two-component system, NtrC family, sensor histidine kinase HydH
MLNHPYDILIYSFFFLIAILVVIILFLPKIVRTRETKASVRIETDMLTESFSMLGNELKSLREQLITKERLATLGEVSAGIAHELRNPMAVILGYSKLLLKEMDAGDARRETVQAIIRELDTMNRVMDELLKFSKSEPLNKTEFDAVEMIRKAIRESVRPDAVRFACDVRFMVKADETLLLQAVKNLINNGLDAGTDVEIRLRAGEVSGKRGGFIEVTDNGTGMSEEQMKKIFSPFYSTKASGLGIGLSLVQKIALAHGSPVEVSSIKGKGSTFRLFIAD